MSATLSPSTAANVATRVYDTRKSTDFENDFNLDFIRNFKVTNSKIKGVSGGVVNQILNRSTGFAFTAEGTTPQFKKHHIIGIRGTKFTSPADWLTNCNVGVTLGPKNIAVHAGFNKTFNSLKPSLNRYINEHRPRCLHIVGHSLGGAIAELTAIWASNLGITSKLYTFGAPRVVLRDSVIRAAHNIEHYRVTHGADPVPCVPVWPFTHTVAEYQIAINGGTFFDFNAHSMAKATPGYINTVAGYNDYKSMASKINTAQYKHTVLQYAQRHQASCSHRWQQIITDALVTILKTTGQYAFLTGQAAAGVSLSFYDILARCLSESILQSPAIAEELKGLLGHILVFVGKGTRTVTDMSIKFIRWVLGLMISTLYRKAKQAIEFVA